VAVGDLSRAEAAIADLRKAIQTDDLAAIKAATAALEQASHAVAEQLYKQGQAQGQAPKGAPDAGSNVKDAEVVDAEYAETV
jgi:molecular chaperone DnaK